MQRLLRIGFNKFIFSFTPILVWFLVGIIIDPRLVNVFSVTYPMQFIYQILLAMFGTAPNINENKDREKGAAFSGFLAGTLLGGIIFLLVALNLDSYISFMNVDYDSYKEFALFSIISFYLQLIFGILMEKLYFSRKEKLANKYMIGFNAIYTIVLIGMSLLSKDKTLIVTVSLMCLTAFIFYAGVKTFRNFRVKLNFRFYKWFRYESFDIATNILQFFVFLFGLSHTASYGIEYIAATNFGALITDTQWDSFDAISTLAKIDISKNKFNYKKSLLNSYKLLAILLFSSFVMFVATIRFYEINIGILMVILAAELYYFLVYPFIALKAHYLQIEYSPLKATSNKIISLLIRFAVSLSKTPFCLPIGAVSSATYQLVAYGFMFRKAPKKLKR